MEKSISRQKQQINNSNSKSRQNKRPSLIFFTQHPDGLVKKPPLASSMQSLETTFFLIALRRYPHALVSCASSIESALLADKECKEKATDMMKKKYPNSQSDRPGFYYLVNAAKECSETIKRVNDKELNDFRKTRNFFTHYGFSPQDDRKSTNLLMQVGIPFLERSYSAFHKFNLFDGLLQNHSELLKVALNVYKKAKSLQDTETYPGFYFHAFGHLINYGLKLNFLTDWEQEALEYEDSNMDIKYEMIYKQKQELEDLFHKADNVAWHFDCPVCHGCETAVCEVDASRLDNREVFVKRMVCVDCNFIVRENAPFLAKALLEKQLEDEKDKILKEFGIK
ncbi:MAG: hypothetical protein NUV86_12195 [Candidatus Scalindua sp.]|nr:hypothetical protein [Candidatus Scalindua sp.]